jgi:hypothetical protein
MFLATEALVLGPQAAPPMSSRCQAMAKTIACMLIAVVVPIAESKAAAPIFDRPHALLAQGRSAEFKWRLMTHRSKERDARHRPCLDLSIAQSPSPIASAPFFSICGTVSPLPTLAAIATDRGTKGKTLVGVALPLNVRLVLMDLGAAGKRRRHTRLLSRSKARAAQLEQFRFASLVVNGAHCVRQLKTFTANGRLVTDTGRHSCV